MIGTGAMVCTTWGCAAISLAGQRMAEPHRGATDCLFLNIGPRWSQRGRGRLETDVEQSFLVFLVEGLH